MIAAAMPTATSAEPKLDKVKTPPEIKKLLTAMRQERVKGLVTSPHNILRNNRHEKCRLVQNSEKWELAETKGY